MKVIGGLIFLLVTVGFGVSLIVNGISVLNGNCDAFVIPDSCLNEQGASSGIAPAVITGVGLIVLGLLAITTFLWLPLFVRFLQSRKQNKEIKRHHESLRVEERRAQYLYSQEQALAETTQSLEGQSTDASTLLNQIVLKVNALRKTSIILSSAAMLIFVLPFLQLAIAPEVMRLIFWVGFGLTIASTVVLVIAEQTKRRHLGRTLQVGISSGKTLLPLGLAIGFSLLFGIPQVL